MENIRQAIERAKGQPGERGPELKQPLVLDHSDYGEGIDALVEEVELDSRFLESKRLIAFDREDVRSRSFDMLRTQVLRSMDQNAWKTVAVTSPTPNCGKTLTAINLAFSIARQPGRQVLLADMDLRKPQISNCLGLVQGGGTIDVLSGRISLSDAITRVRAGNCSLKVLPTSPISQSSDLMGSQEMATFFQDIRAHAQSMVVIFDMPPLLNSDDVAAVLPQIDCALLVAAVGNSTPRDIEECHKHLYATDVVKFVLNKVPKSNVNYYY
jgi:Mrp family chromosome partitioning ATPase